MRVKDKKALVARLRAEGYNCAQCLLLVEGEEVGLDSSSAKLTGAGLGGGASCGELCGVASSLAILCGYRQQDTTSGGKLKVMPRVRALLTEFSEPYDGRLTCRDLKGKCGVDCLRLIERGVEIFESTLGED